MKPAPGGSTSSDWAYYQKALVLVTDLKAEYGNTEITTFVDKILCGATYATILNR